MRSPKMKATLEQLAQRGIPENLNLWPNLAAELERKSPMNPNRTRPFAAILMALIVLFMLSGVAYALGIRLGYIPGLGIVDQTSQLRVLAEPVSQTRGGIKVTVENAVLSADRSIVVVAFENVPVDKVPNQEETPDCYPAPALRLSAGAPLQPTGSQGNDWGSGSRYHYTYAAVPPANNEATLFIGCVPGDVLPRVLPENWEIPLRFVAAPPDMTALPVLEYVPTSVPTTAATDMPISITKVVELADSYILMGKFVIQTNSLGYSTMGMRTLLDGKGNFLPWKMPQDAVFPPSSPDGLVTTEDWAVQVDKGFVPPLTIKFSTVSSYPTRNDPPLTYEFDAGEKPELGQEWQVNQEFNAAGRIFKLLSIRVDTNPETPGAFGYRFNFEPMDNAISNLYLDINGLEFMSYSTEDAPAGLSYFVGYSELPKGKLKVSFSLELSDPQVWSLQWTPDAPANIIVPTASPQACLTPDSWQSALANPAPIPANLTGALVGFARTVEDGKDLNPSNSGMFTINLDGSNKQFFGQGVGPFAPDGSQVAYSDVDGLYLVNLASGTTNHIPNTVDGDYLPHWSPDGKQIAFFRNLDADLYVIQPDGSGLRRALQGIDAEELKGWTSDGRCLYYVVSTQNGAELRQVDLESQSVTIMFGQDGYAFFDVSPDGTKIAFEGHPNNFYVSNMDGSGSELLGLMGNMFIFPFVVWSPDGQWLIVNLREQDDPGISGALVPHVLVSVTGCQIIPIPWAGEIYGWVP